MTALSIQPPYPIFTEADGSPLENGFVYIGTANLDPVANPIAVFWDAALTIPAAQPIRTLNGYPSRNGTPARLYVGSDYSIRVNDAKGVTVYSAPAATERWSNVVVTGADASEVNFLQAGAGAQPRTAQAKLRDTVSVLDFGAVGNGSTDDTVALQAALDSGASFVYIPGTKAGRKYIFTNLIVRARTKLFGDGPRASVLRQAISATGVALTFETGTPPTGGPVNDISEGAYNLESLGIEVKGSTGIRAASGLYSMLSTRNVRIVHQNSETLGAPPYSVVAGSRGIDLNGGAGTTANIYVADHVNLEIRNFETGIYARNTVNEWRVHGWLIDCQIGLDADGVSTWYWNASIESGVANARGFKFSGNVSNIICIGGRVELTQTGPFMVEFVGTVTCANVRFREQNINILGDGGGWPGRKYTGTLPKDVLFEFTNTATNDSRIAGATTNETAYTFPLRFGGTGLGNGSVTFGRNIGGADSTISHDGTNLVINAGNYAQFAGASGATGYLKAVMLGAAYLWVDSSGRLRIKSASAPTSDTDGTVVGTQV